MRCYTIGVHYTYLDLPPKPSVWLGCETPNYINKYFILPQQHVPKRV